MRPAVEETQPLDLGGVAPRGTAGPGRGPGSQCNRDADRRDQCHREQCRVVRFGHAQHTGERCHQRGGHECPPSQGAPRHGSEEAEDHHHRPHRVAEGDRMLDRCERRRVDGLGNDEREPVHQSSAARFRGRS